MAPQKWILAVYAALRRGGLGGMAELCERIVGEALRMGGGMMPEAKVGAGGSAGSVNMGSVNMGKSNCVSDFPYPPPPFPLPSTSSHQAAHPPAQIDPNGRSSTVMRGDLR